MPGQSWIETLISSNVDGAAVTSTTATSILHATAKLSLPPHFFRIGKRLRVSAAGRCSVAVTEAKTLTLDIRMGPTSNIIVANGGPIGGNIVAKVNLPWFLEWDLTCRAVGNTTTANIMHQGMFTSECVIGSPLATVGSAGTAMLPAGVPAVGTGFDSTVSMIVDMFAVWSTVTAGNTITCHQFMIEDMNPSY